MLLRSTLSKWLVQAAVKLLSRDARNQTDCAPTNSGTCRGHLASNWTTLLVRFLYRIL